MTSTDNQLFSIEEALSRLGQTREQGCLLAYKDAELIQIYVQDGFVVRAQSRVKQGSEAVEQALHLAEGSYQWVRGIQPADPTHNIFLSIREFLARHGNITKANQTETGRLASGLVRRENKALYKYYLVPRENQTVKHIITKNSTVLGRDETCDLVINNRDVSRRHCVLDVHARGLFVLDIDSTNGTFINGILVHEGYLNPGDQLQLGPYMLVVNREPILEEGR